MQQTLVSPADLLKVLRKAWLWILLGALVGLGIAGAYTKFCVPKKYTSSLLLSCSAERGTQSVSDYNFSISLTPTYAYLLTDVTTLERVAQTLGGDLTAGSIGGMLSVTAVEETCLLRVSATTEVPRLSAELCTVLAELAPGILVDYGYASQVHPYGEAPIPSAPSSPNPNRNMLLGFIIGAMLVFGICLVKELFDCRIQRTDEIKERFNVPILGEIPAFRTKQPSRFLRR